MADPGATYRYDVFVSYNRTSDRRVGEELATRLVEYGLSVFLDTWKLTVGQPFAETIEKGIIESRFLVAVISPATIDSPWTAFEYTTAVAREPSRVIPLLIGGASPPAALARLQALEVRSATAREMDAAARKIRDRIQRDRHGLSVDPAEFALREASAALPALDRRGFLPPGTYDASLEHVLERFGRGSAQRSHLATELRAVAKRARAMGADSLILGGSFISDKLDPQDLDVAIVIPERTPDELVASGAAAIQQYVKSGKSTFIASGSESVRLWTSFLANDFFAEPRGVVRIWLGRGINK